MSGYTLTLLGLRVITHCAKKPSVSGGFPPIFGSSTEYVRKWLCLQHIFGTATIYSIGGNPRDIDGFSAQWQLELKTFSWFPSPSPWKLFRTIEIRLYRKGAYILADIHGMDHFCTKLAPPPYNKPRSCVSIYMVMVWFGNV
jgi:hypothetical protein